MIKLIFLFFFQKYLHHLDIFFYIEKKNRSARDIARATCAIKFKLSYVYSVKKIIHPRLEAEKNIAIKPFLRVDPTKKPVPIHMGWPGSTWESKKKSVWDFNIPYEKVKKQYIKI